MDILSFVKYVLNQKSVTSGYNLDELCAHAEFLQQKSQFIKSNQEVQNYEPIFSHYQKPTIEK